MRCNVLASGVFLLAFCFVSLAGADMYKYVDETGAVCMTNTLQSVPKKYRSSMTVIKEEVQTKKTLLPEVQLRTSDPAPYIAPQAVVPESRPPSVDNRNRYISSGLIIVGIVAGYFVLVRLMGSLGFPKAGMLLFMGVALAGGVYLYGLYIKEMDSIFGTLRKDAQQIKKNVETRDVKTEQMLKKMPEVD